MNIFEKGVRSKVRFQSEKGNLTIEDLYDLSLAQLNRLAKKLSKALKESAEEDFLEDKSAEDTYMKLQFDIVLHVLTTKKEENEARKNAVAKKAQREKILEAIARKQDESLENMSEDELKKLLEEV